MQGHTIAKQCRRAHLFGPGQRPERTVLFLSRLHLKKGVVPLVQAWLESEGVAPGTWGQVQAGWVNRMSKNEAVRTRYGVLYAQA